MLIPVHLLQPRALPRVYVARDRLVELMAGYDHAQVLVLEAPGGYGKSIAVAELIRRTGVRFAWLPLNFLPDTSHLSFVWNLANAIQVSLPSFGHRIDMLFKETLGDSQHQGANDWLQTSVLPALIAEFATVNEPLLVVLEDYHVISDDAVHRTVSNLIEQSPPNVRLVVISRQPPTWSARSRWEGQDLLATISADQLAFTPFESRTLAEGLGVQLTQAQIDEVHRRIGGWPILHHLLYTSCRDKQRDEIAETLRVLAMPNSAIYNYLAGEFLNKRSFNDRDFLCRTSILHQLEPASCNALLETTNAADILESLSGSWFLAAITSQASRWPAGTPVDENGETRSETGPSELFSKQPGQSYVHSHEIVRYFLQLVLRREYSSEEIENLYSRLGHFWESRNDLSQAIASFCEGERYQEASRLVAEHAQQMIDQSRAPELSTWFHRIPQDRWENDPNLLTYRALALANNDQPLAETYLHRAQRLFEQSGQMDKALWARTELGWVYFLENKHLLCLETLLEVQADALPALWIQPKLHHYLAIAMLNAGKLESAAAHGEKAVELLRRSENGTALARVLRFLASVYERSGRPWEAIQRLDEAAKLTEALRLGNWSLAWIHNQIAVMHLHLGQIEEARHHVDNADQLLEPYRQLGSRSPLLHFVQIVRGHLQREMYDYARAEQMYRLAKRGHPNGVLLALRLVQPGHEHDALMLAQERWRTKQFSENPIERAKNQGLLGVAYLTAGNYRDAQYHLEAAEVALDQRGVLYELTTFRLYLAKLHLVTGRQKEATQHLRFVFGQMAEHGYYGLDIWQPWTVSELCAQALRDGIEPDFVERLATKRLTSTHMKPFLSLVNEPKDEVRTRAIRVLRQVGDTLRLQARQTLDSCGDQSTRARLLNWLEDGWLTEIGILRLRESLSWRETEVFLAWMSPKFRGSVTEIATELGIAPDTINTHLKKVREVFDTMRENGLISFDLSGKGAYLEAYDWAIRNSIVDPRVAVAR